MAVRLHRFIPLLCILFSCSGNTNQISFFISGGPNFSTLKNNTCVNVNEVITNAYQTHTKTNWQSFGAVGVYHLFDSLTPYKFTLGITGYLFDLGQIQGTELPFINEGIFDTLNYNFHAKSASLMVESKAMYSKYVLKPYALIGMGSSWNRFYSYHEEPTIPFLSAAPGIPFNNYSKQTFSYELGVGFEYVLWNDQQHHIQYSTSAGYQYFNLGEGELGRSLPNTFTDRLKIKNLYTQGIVCTLAVSFG